MPTLRDTLKKRSQQKSFTDSVSSRARQRRAARTGLVKPGEAPPMDYSGLSEKGLREVASMRDATNAEFQRQEDMLAGRDPAALQQARKEGSQIYRDAPRHRTRTAQGLADQNVANIDARAGIDSGMSAKDVLGGINPQSTYNAGHTVSGLQTANRGYPVQRGPHIAGSPQTVQQGPHDANTSVETQWMIGPEGELVPRPSAPLAGVELPDRFSHLTGESNNQQMNFDTAGKYAPGRQSQMAGGSIPYRTASGGIGLRGAHVEADENGRPLPNSADGTANYGRSGPLADRYAAQVERHGRLKSKLFGGPLGEAQRAVVLAKTPATRSLALHRYRQLQGEQQSQTVDTKPLPASKVSIEQRQAYKRAGDAMLDPESPDRNFTALTIGIAKDMNATEMGRKIYWANNLNNEDLAEIRKVIVARHGSDQDFYTKYTAAQSPEDEYIRAGMKALAEAPDDADFNSVWNLAISSARRGEPNQGTGEPYKVEKDPARRHHQRPEYQPVPSHDPSYVTGGSGTL